MSRPVQVLFGIGTVLLLIAGPVVVAVRQQQQMRNFRVVREGVLYRSAQMSLDGLRRAVHDYGIKTVINLRDGMTAADQAEEQFCNREEITFVRIPPSSWGESCGTVPVEESVRKFRDVLSDPRNYPVLVHCFAGVHRTGAYCAIYRMEFEHWTNERALAEMKACGYTNLDDEWDILGYLEQYRPSWQAPGHPNAEVRMPSAE
jgi:protein tyrosine/serine phosphatase